MNNNLLDIGVGVFRGSGQEESQEQAILELVARALEGVKTTDLPVRFALLLATADWCRSENPLPAQVRRVLKEQLGHEVPLIGGSSSQLYVSTEPASSRFIQRGLSLVIFCSEEMWLTVTSLEEPHAAPPEERRRNVSQITRSLLEAAGSRLGASANRFLFGFLPGVITDEAGQRAYYDHDLHQDLLTALSHKYLFFGASTTGHIEPTTGYQFANDQCLKSGLALGLLETDLCLGAAMSHGFGKLSAPRVSIDGLADADPHEEGYILTELNKKPAVQYIQELKDKGLVNFDRPIFGSPQGSDFNIYWPLEPLSAKDARIRLKRKVKLGDQLYLLDAMPEEMLKTAAKTIDIAIKKSSAPRLTDVSVLLCFICGGRSRQFEFRQINWKDTVEKVQQKYPDIPIVGAMVAGEFGIDEEHKSRSNNMGMSIICPVNAYQRRARIRSLQRYLVEAASHFLNCGTPKEVMREAIKGAIVAGATGGKINIVDRHLGRILGMDFGCALNAPNSRQDWEAVAKHTNYEIPKTRGGEFPLDLKANAMPVVPDSPIKVNFVTVPTQFINGKWDNILQLVVRTQHAVFISDWLKHERDGLCNTTARAEGNLISELVMPLVGSRFNVIATLQLSFEDDSPLDRESLALWVSYGQKVAGALELAEETEQRKILEQISELGNEISNTQLDYYETPFEWCEKYLRKIAELLGADTGNIRALEQRSELIGVKQYRLVATTGMLEHILPKARLSIPEDDPGFFRDLRVEGPQFLHSEEDITALAANIKPIENEHLYAEELADVFRRIKSAAIIPLIDHEELLGTLYIYSVKQYFFTARLKNVVLHAAASCAAILRARKVEYERESLNRQMKHIQGLLTLTTEGTAGERIKQMLVRVCDIVGADVGSIYAWHNTPEKLVLHTSHNWYEPYQEGKAEYSEGEEWTGKMAQNGQKDIVYVDSVEDVGRDTEKYYDSMIDPSHRSKNNESRIGVRLSAGKKLLGVMTLVYYSEHANILNDQPEYIKAFLEDAKTHIALGLELAQREAREERTRRFFDTNEQVYNLLVKSKPDRANWEAALSIMRDSFEVDCLTYYRLERDKFVADFRSQVGEGDLRPDEMPLATDSPLMKVISEQAVVWMSDDSELSQWPGIQSVTGGRRINSLIAVPIAADRTIYGLLEVVNRQRTPAHPFESFEELEKKMLADIAKLLRYSIEEQEEKRKLRLQLANATKIGARMLSGAFVMHQLMTPFVNIRGVIDWLLRHPASPSDERAEYLKQIEKFYQQAMDIIQQPRRRGISGPHGERLRNLVHQAMKFIDPAGIKINLKNELSVVVFVDPMSITIALVSLLSNAIEEMNGKGVLTVSTQLSGDGKFASIRIHNTTAKMITEEDIVIYFQDGFSTKSDKDHLGLGIPLAMSAIEAAGGTLLLAANDGFEAVVSLPLAEVTE